MPFEGDESPTTNVKLILMIPFTGMTMTTLTVKIDAGTAIDDDQLDEMTSELEQDLAEFDHLSVSRVKDGPAEAGSKAFENIAFDAVVVDFVVQFVAGALPVVIAA